MYIHYAVVQLSQTVPSPGIVPCYGDRIVLTCTTDNGNVIWWSDDGIFGFIRLGQSAGESILYAVTALNGNIITSTATIKSVTESYNGTRIGCSRDFTYSTYMYLHINIAG